MARWHEQVHRAGTRIDRFGFDGHVVELQGSADLRESLCKLRLRLERDHPAVADPARQPKHKTALVGADVAGDIARLEMPPDRVEFGALIAQPGF